VASVPAAKLEFRQVPDSEHDSKVIEEAEKLLNDFKPADVAKGLPAPKGYAWLPVAEIFVKDRWKDRPPAAGFEVNLSAATYHTDKQHWLLTSIPAANNAVTHADLKSVGDVKEEKGLFIAEFLLTSTAGERFGELTKTTGRYLCIMVDGKVLSAPRINAQIKDRVPISLGTSKEGKTILEQTVKSLRAGLKKNGEDK
jgi:preprotein translocase subunit SecD